MKILIVDDNDDDRKLLKCIIEKNGHNAIEAENGSMGLQKAKDHIPSLIISDALMPIMDGFTFLRTVKQDKDLRLIKFIFYSASYRENRDVQLAMSLGADAYIIKPLEPVELWMNIEKILHAIQNNISSVSLVEEDPEYLKRYSEVVTMQLEKKVIDLENALELRKLGDKALRESENRYKQLLESVTDYLYTVKFQDCRPVSTIHGPGCLVVTGYSPEDYEKDPYLWYRMIHEQDRAAVVERNDKILSGRSVKPLEFRIYHKDGNLRWVCNTIVPKFDEDNKLVSYDGSIKDITERKEAEERIRGSLAEKEALLRELYHRTKNNMQVIISMLDLQMTNFHNEELQEVFEIIKKRIQSMALAQQMLYESKDLSNINLREYIIELVQYLIKSYSLQESKIQLDYSSIENIHVHIDCAVPCGLILNELISNSLKHAFPGNRPGNIIISLNKNFEKTLLLTVSDDGIGVNRDFDFKTEAKLGLMIVFNIVELQLHGNISFKSCDGVTCSVGFRDTIYRKRV